ncbi:MAG: signal peptidase II [Nanoarchaeota archaeon]
MIILILLLIILDQITKFIFPSIINTGIAFGLLKGYNLLFILVNLIILAIVIYYYIKNKKVRLALSFLIAGIIGNLIDRIFFNGVRDFIDLKFWPVFNLADSFNVIGVILIFYLVLKNKV